MDRAIGSPSLAPFEPQKWFGAGKRIHFDAADTDVTVSPVLQYPIEWRTLQLTQGTAWNPGCLGERVHKWCIVRAFEAKCRVVFAQKAVVCSR
jgi:hypothetical protein